MLIDLPIGPEVQAGFNPMCPCKDEAVMCYGRYCCGHFTSTPGSQIDLWPAMSCKCMREHMGWQFDA